MKLRLAYEPLQFTGVAFDKPNKTLVFCWIAETEVSNIILIRLLALRLRFPPIKIVTAFTDKREYEYER